MKCLIHYFNRLQQVPPLQYRNRQDIQRCLVAECGDTVRCRLTRPWPLCLPDRAGVGNDA